MTDELREYWTTGPGSLDLSNLASPFDLRPDPRLSNLCPGWLQGEGWRGRLSSLLDEDVEWIERQWDVAGGRAPAVDTSWITYEQARWGEPNWAIVAATLAVVVLLLGAILAAVAAG